MSDLLEKLKRNRTSILLAEIGAYLHDLGKARKEFIERYTKNGGSGWDGHNFPSIFPDKLREILFQTEVQFLNEKVRLIDFIEKHHKEKEGGNNLKDCEIPPLIRLLYAGWNGYDGMDSGLDKGWASAKQSRNNIFISTAFGYEPEENKIKNVDKLTDELYRIIEKAFSDSNNNIIKLRNTIMNETKIFYLKFLGETRRSANDITLWDHSYSVATLVKCAVVKNILDCSNASFDPLDFNWKILSVNFDVLSILSKGIKISDIFGYREKIKEAYKKIKKIVEEKYPLGNEIYQDNSGIYFLMPTIEPEELIEILKNNLKNVEPELMPAISARKTSNLQHYNYRFNCNNLKQDIPSRVKSQRSNIEKSKKEDLIKILPETRYFILQEIFYPSSSVRFFSDKFNNNWSNKEICPICRLRPMKENFDRCKHCLDRRIGQAENWIGQTQKQTIWLDESSDHNDRVALLVGCFILDNWLNGSFIKTMAIAIRNNVPTPKHPSPARIRRCWETTQEFIKNTVLDGIVKNYSYAEGSPHIELRNKRIKFTISPSPNIPKGSTIDIDIDGVRLSPVCIDKSNGVFISTTNLQILSNKGKTVDEIASWMNRKETKIKKENESKWQGEYCISNASPAELKFQDYLPYVPIYDFPDQFMVLVPAYDAMEVAKKIVDAYEIHFSKVRDRLPFHLGLIAFHRRTPLYVAMDAGKRLVETFRRKTKTINARVDAITQVQDSELGNYVKKITLNADPCYSSVPLVWQMSYSTGDPAQEDEWHPYIRVNGNPNRGDYSFDYDGNGNHVVHVKELQPNDCVKIETSYLKITFFETASDRFKVDEKLLPLDDLKRLDEIWSDIQSIISSKRIDIAQIYAFWQEFKKRYEEYSGDLVWESFVKSSLTNIFKLSPTKDSELFNKLFQATKDGLLDLCLYWNLQVRKIKPEEQEVK